jgi:hypothetical protein
MALSTELKDTKESAITSPDTYRVTSASEMPENLEQVVALAKVMAASGFYQDATTPQKAAAIMLLGIQFGIPPAQALTAIHVVKGKPMLHYSALLSKVRQHPDYDYNILESTAKVARIQWERKGKVIGETVFTEVDAKRQGTQNMEKFPDTMLLARAVSNGVKRYCPDVINGMPVYTPGEIQEDEAVYTGKAGTKADALRAEMQAKAQTESIEAEHRDVSDEQEQEALV